MIQTSQTTTTDYSLVVSSIPSLFYRVNGYFSSAGTSNYFIMLFDTNAGVPANGTRPLKSYIAQPNFEFNEHIGDGVPLKNGLVIALSSTENTLTLATGTNVADIQVEWEQYITLAVIPVVTTVGDKTTATNHQQIWAEASGPHKVVSATFIEQAGTASFIVAVCTDASVNLNYPFSRIWPIAANATLNLTFGINGSELFSQDSAGVIHQGLTFLCSTAAPPSTNKMGSSTFLATYI